MKLEKNMYIRYIPTLGEYTQKISKITDMKNCLLDMAYTLDNEQEPVFSSHFDDIIKASHNIIDLIEVGDYVNGYKVYYCYCADEDSTGLFFDTEKGRQWLDKPRQVKSIVTKEQFESMSYKIGE